MVKIWEGKVVEWGDVEEVVEILDIHLEIMFAVTSHHITPVSGVMNV